jgi:hypothetical protein
VDAIDEEKFKTLVKNNTTWKYPFVIVVPTVRSLMRPHKSVISDQLSDVSFQFTDYCLLDGYAVPLATLKKSSLFPSHRQS